MKYLFKVLFLLTASILTSCTSLPDRKLICETDVIVLHDVFSLQKRLPDAPFHRYYYPAIQLENVDNKCGEYISEINKTGKFFLNRFQNKSQTFQERIFNNTPENFNYMLPTGSGKNQLHSGQTIRIAIYSYKPWGNIFVNPVYRTTFVITKFY